MPDLPYLEANMNQSVLSKLSILTLSVFAFSGCAFTGSLWDSSYRKFPEPVLTEDNIHSFGFTKPDSQNLPANRLVMLGEKIAYVTDITPQHDLVKVLRTTELSRPFQIVNRYGDPTKLEVSLYQNNNNRFYADSDTDAGKGYLCLGYYFQPTDKPALKKREVAILTQLGFKLSGSPQAIEEQKAPYKRCYDTVSGQAYAMSTPLPAEYRFQSPLPVTIKTIKESVGEVDGAALAGAVLLTPFAIIGDIIMLPLTPFMWPRGSKI